MASLLGDDPARIPLDLPAISARLAAVSPAAAGLTKKTFSNIRSDFVSAVKITLRFSRVVRAVPTRSAPSPSFGVLAIATDPHARGTGAGRALMHEAEARARRLGHPRLTLTVSPDNAHAVRFYEQLGWVRAADDGTWTGTMVRTLA